MSMVAEVEIVLTRAEAANRAGDRPAAMALLGTALSCADAVARERGVSLLEADRLVRTAFKFGAATLDAESVAGIDFYPQYAVA